MESLTGKLSNLDSSNSSLWIIPASELRESKVTTPEAAMKKFGATIVVEGAYRSEPDGIHLQLSLIDPHKTRQIGYIDLNARQMDLTSLEDEAVARMVRLMNINLRSAPRQTEAGTTQTAAYEDYLAGVGYFDRQDKSGNLDHAVTSLQSAIKKDPNFAMAYALLTQVELLRYRLDSNPKWIQDANDSSRKAVELGPQLPEAYVALGQYQNMTGNRELAIQEYQRALSLDSRNVEALQGIANLYATDGKLREAEGAYQRAIDLRPGDWKVYNALGNFYLNSGRPSKAAEEFQRVIQLTPDNSWAYINLGIAYEEEDDANMLPRAEEELRHSIALDPSFSGWSNLGDVYALQNRLQDAVSAYKLALNLNSRYPAVWANLAQAYDGLHDEQDSDSARHQAIALYQKTLATLYARDGQAEESLRAIHYSLAQSPNDPYVLFQVAEAYKLLGERKDAVRTLQLALNKGLSVSYVRSTPDMKDLLLDPSIRIPSRP
jgi:serine/threonine-protein kinase